MLPTDPRIRSLSPYQSLYLSAHIAKEKDEERDYIYNIAKMVCAVVNPTMASKVFKNTEQEVTENENFEGDIKSLDPNFDPKSVEDLLGDDDGIV